jgi:hypothetical protein
MEKNGHEDPNNPNNTNNLNNSHPPNTPNKRKISSYDDMKRKSKYSKLNSNEPMNLQNNNIPKEDDFKNMIFDLMDSNPDQDFNEIFESTNIDLTCLVDKDFYNGI